MTQFKVVELENKLQEIDNDYLKDDIATKKVFSKKSKNARKKTLPNVW